MDLSPDTLEFLTHLMCAQARECLFEKNELALYEDDDDKKAKKADIDKYLAVGQEAAYVSFNFYNLNHYQIKRMVILPCPLQNLSYFCTHFNKHTKTKRPKRQTLTST